MTAVVDIAVESSRTVDGSVDAINVLVDMNVVTVEVFVVS